MSNDGLKIVTSRINKTYSNWHRGTSMAQMRSDWDQMFTGSLPPCRCEDFSVGKTACRWIFPAKHSVDGVVLYAHGGGFRLGSIDSHQQLMANISHHSGCPVLGFNYRLMPEHIFPAALEDTLEVYRWLLDSGYQPTQIIIAGDSAGGQLGAAMLQVLKQRQEAMPAASILLSAWLDMSLGGASYDSRAIHDPIHQKKMLAKIAKQYLGDENNVLQSDVSPLFGNLNNLPPTLIQVGDYEVGLDDSIEYANRLAQAGNQVNLQVAPEMIHVYQMFPDELEQANIALRAIGEFIKLHLPTLK